MSPRPVVRVLPVRKARTPLGGGDAWRRLDEPMWPDEGSDTDPDFVPGESSDEESSDDSVSLFSETDSSEDDDDYDEDEEDDSD